ncbi:MAG: Peptidase and in, kexin, sedolisin, partial [Verrucomicrobiaceae bacterium]|nr:Peptidase and in, kexin, sedolisin [Verrucomicrobiaceae bacterium]
DNMSVVGFGIPSSLNAVECKEHSVILYWQGEIPVDNTAIFRVHVPADLATVGRGKKRITVSVATSPRVQRWGLSEYLGVEAQFRLFRGDRDPQAIQAALQRESVEEENKAVTAEPDLPSSIGVGINRRSFGTLQKDVFEWSDHTELYSANDYTLALTLRKASWEADSAMVQAAVVVRLEDTTGRCQTLYSKVRAAVQARTRA